jgi:SH3-like domain-containing protein
LDIVASMTWITASLIALNLFMSPPEAPRDSGYLAPQAACLQSKAGVANLRTRPGRSPPLVNIHTIPPAAITVLGAHEHWRRIRTTTGATGWVHRSMIWSCDLISVVRPPTFTAERYNPSLLPHA